MINETQKNSNPDQLTRRQKIARRLLPAVALSLAAGGYGAHKLHEEYEESHDFNTVANVSYKISGESNPTEAIEGALSRIGAMNPEGEHIAPSDIPNIVSEGQELAREFQEETGDSTIEPGDSISVSLLKNGNGDYKVEADPIADQKH